MAMSVDKSHCYMQFNQLALRFYTQEEIHKLSVLEIDQVKTFDEAGFPIKKGLYDEALGVSDQGYECETCGLGGLHCPGHFGHIRLSVPTFNPLLFSFTYNLMKGSCVHCHRFTSSTPSSSGGKHEEGDGVHAFGSYLVEQEALEPSKAMEEGESPPTKHRTKADVADRNGFLKAQLSGMLFKHRDRCPHCRMSNARLRNDKGRALILDFSKAPKKLRDKQAAMKKGKGEEALVNAANNTEITLLRREIKVETPLQEEEGEEFEVGAEDEGLGDEEEANEDTCEDEEEDGEDEDRKELKLMRKMRANREKQRGGKGVVASSMLDPLLLSEMELAAQMSRVLDGSCDRLLWRAAEVREHMRLLWLKEGQTLTRLFPSLFNDMGNAYPVDVLFIESLLVEPVMFRPIFHFHGDRVEHPRTIQFRRVMEADQLLTVIRITMSADNSAEGRKKRQSISVVTRELIDKKVVGKTIQEKLHNAYVDLQVQVNLLYDEDAAGVWRDAAAKKPGLKQIFERKEGIFRMNMMGKRVNFACRSIITPDPYLDVDEIGVPVYYARKLTLTEPVSYLNAGKMRANVRSGPDHYPGANAVDTAKSQAGQHSHAQSSGMAADLVVTEAPMQTQRLNKGDATQRAVCAKRLVEGKSQVYRHMENGDSLLMNRQPTLHKPSIMGHRIRVLRTDAKALRMNYAPCKAYNADFDGDEMNGHFVQSRIAQTEASQLMSVSHNYLVPKDGTPILGLIQDHVVSGVLLTLRDTFLAPPDFMRLVFAAFTAEEMGHGGGAARRLYTPRPAMLLPQRLYTGKQVVTTLLRNIIPEGGGGQPSHCRINLTTKSKTPPSCWGVPDERGSVDFEMSESNVIFRDGELLCGVIDKQHCGATQFGLTHCCHELYGPRFATKLLSCFSRVFTTYLQMRGFTLGVADILMSGSADTHRQGVIEEIKECGPAIVRKALDLEEQEEEKENLRTLKKAMGAAHNNPQLDTGGVKLLDHSAKTTLDKMSKRINDCLRGGLIRSFPSNNLQLMILSGAKGTIVNAIQISCALGQIELEGQRPPLTAHGRSLPSFGRYDPSPRAGGFVHQRFLTGISPQELFFHTMAGREGLIDTAVKTSRSGYLQRCVIKHMEGLSVQYDGTVRDHDKSVIQFRYGEDGLDVGRAVFLHPRQFPFLGENCDAALASAAPSSDFSGGGGDSPQAMLPTPGSWDASAAEKQYRRIVKWRKKQMERKRSADGRQRPCPVDEKYNPCNTLGALPEHILDQLAGYLRGRELAFRPSAFGEDDDGEAAAEFKRLIYWKGLRALVDPGDNVGLLAAQSIGEPSTQMTLNTFHFAGRGEMNVTLGIPRLREILMTFSRNIKTPMAEVRFRAGVAPEQIEKVRGELTPIKLTQLLESSSVEEHLVLIPEGGFTPKRRYILRLQFLKKRHREAAARHLSFPQIFAELERRFFREVAASLAKRNKEVVDQELIVHHRLRKANIDAGVGGGFPAAAESAATPATARQRGPNEETSDEDQPRLEARMQGMDLDASEHRQSNRHQDDAEYEGEDEDRMEVGGEDEGIAGEGDGFDEGEGIEQQNQEAEAAAESSEAAAENIEAMRTEKAAGAGTLAGTDDAKKERVNGVVKTHAFIHDYDYDESNHGRWCQVVFSLKVKSKIKFDARSLIHRDIDRFVVQRVAGVENALVREEQRQIRGGKKGEMESVHILQTQGINLEAFHKRAEVLDLSTIYSNDINLIMKHYGIEAAARTIVKEMNQVFGVYGIHVDPRHLGLTADYMSFTGDVQPFNRYSMSFSASPLQKMSFETTTNFTREALINGENDDLRSPSARLITGQLLNNGGTGCFDLLQRLDYLLGIEM